jgi:pilus assembly protein CpaB
MFRGKSALLIVLSLVFAIGAAWAANRWVQARTTPGGQQSATVSVVTAAIDIPFGTKVEERHLSVIQMLRGTEPSGSYRAIKDVEGKVSRASLLSGEVLLNARFADQGSGSTLAAVVEKNMRAVSVRVDDVVGVSGFLLPGNRVDVVAARDVNHGQAVTETILQNVRVLAVDQKADETKGQLVVVGKTATLEVNPAEAEIIASAQAAGTLSLALRSIADLDEKPVSTKEGHVTVRVFRAGKSQDIKVWSEGTSIQ